MTIIFDCIKTFFMALGGLAILALVGLVTAFAWALIARAWINYRGLGF